MSSRLVFFYVLSKQAKKLKKFYLLLLRSTSSINYRQIVTWKRKVQGDLRRFGCHICWTYRILIRTKKWKKTYIQTDIYQKNSKKQKNTERFSNFHFKFFSLSLLFFSFEYLWFFYTFFFYKNLEILVTFCYFFKKTHQKKVKTNSRHLPIHMQHQKVLENQFSWLFLSNFTFFFHEVASLKHFSLITLEIDVLSWFHFIF